MEELKEIIFDLFNEYESCEDIVESLRGLNSEGEISDSDYDYLLENYEDLLQEWESQFESKKMFLVYESYYNEIVLNVGESTNIIGLYDSKEKAFKKAQEIIDTDIKKNNYVLDIEEDNLIENNYVRLFWNNQENWSCYYEICIEKIGVE